MERIRMIIGIIGVMVLAFVAAGCSHYASISHAETTSVKAENLRIAEIALPYLGCSGCAQSSQTAFKNMPGVVDAAVYLETKKGEVVYDSSVISKEQLVEEAIIQSYGGEIIDDEEYHQYYGRIQ